MTTTPSAEEYLEAIYRLGGEEHLVPLPNLADHLGLSAPSVNEMVRRLTKLGLVQYTPYRGVRLTPAGICQALTLIRRHRLWERFLTDILGLPWEIVHEEACRLEHAASELVTERLAEILESPDRCPHGAPVPPPECHPPPHSDAIPLTEMAVGMSGTVAYITRESTELLCHLAKLGLRPDTKLRIVDVAPLDGPITVEIDGENQVVGHKIAQYVYINPNEEVTHASPHPLE